MWLFCFTAHELGSLIYIWTIQRTWSASSYSVTDIHQEEHLIKQKWWLNCVYVTKNVTVYIMTILLSYKNGCVNTILFLRRYGLFAIWSHHRNAFRITLHPTKLVVSLLFSPKLNLDIKSRNACRRKRNLKSRWCTGKLWNAMN